MCNLISDLQDYTRFKLNKRAAQERRIRRLIIKLRIFKAYVKATRPELSNILKKSQAIEDELNFLIKKDEHLRHLLKNMAAMTCKSE